MKCARDDIDRVLCSLPQEQTRADAEAMSQDTAPGLQRAHPAQVSALSQVNYNSQLQMRSGYQGGGGGGGGGGGVPFNDFMTVKMNLLRAEGRIEQLSRQLQLEQTHRKAMEARLISLEERLGS